MIITVQSENTTHELKQAASGRWWEILSQNGLPFDSLDGRHHPCPKCGGKDRFRLLDAEAGAVFCNHCFSKGNGDGLAALQWLTGCDFREACNIVANHCGLITTQGKPQVQRDLIELVCIDKRMPLEAFKQFQPTIETRGRQRKPVVRVPVFNESGEPHSYFDLAPGGKGWFARGQGMAGLFFPGRLPQPGETWCLVEGVKDAAALIGLGFNAAGLPTANLAAKYARLFAGCEIVIVHDLDSAGVNGAQLTGGRLAGVASSVRVARLPGELVESGGADVRDILRMPDGKKLVRQAILEASPWQPREGEQDGRPEILVSLNEGHVAEKVVGSLGELGWDSPWLPKRLQETVKVFVRGGSLVDCVESEDTANRGQLIIRKVPASILRERITQACRLKIEKVNKDNETETFFVPPPKWLVDAIEQRGHYSGKVRHLAGIVETPTLRPDGSIIQIAGYDERTGLVYRPNASYPAIPETPTAQDAKQAIAELLETVCDFPFLSSADLSCWLALVLTMIARVCVAGCCPLFAVTSNIRGSGKSLLVDSASLIAYGRPAARKPFSRDNEELRKSITAVAIESIPAVLFDNVDVQLGGTALDMVLTADSWSDRILGQSKTTGELPLKTVWSCTGNNLAYGTDIARRVLPIRLQSPLESPEERKDFRHSDLLGWVRSNRPRLAVAAITILRAYFAAGKPLQSGDEWGSFENWTRLVRGSLVWLELSDPLTTRETAKACDDSKTLVSMLIAGIAEADPDGVGITTREIERITSHRVDESPTCPSLSAAVSEICGERFNARRFARVVRSFVGRTVDGKQIESVSSHGGVKRWRVRSVSGGCGGSGGCQQPILNDEKLCVSHLKACDTHISEMGVGRTQQPQPPQQPVDDSGEEGFVYI